MFDCFLLSAIFVSLLAGQFARIELINTLANVYVHEFLIFIFICTSAMRYGFSSIRALFKSKVVIIFFALVLFSFGISFKEFTFMQNGIAFLYFLRVVLYLLFGVYLFELVRKNKNMRILLYKLLYVFSILLLIVSAIQFIFFPNFRSLYAFGWDPHLYRASAIYLDVFVAAAIYGLLALFWYSKRKRILSALFIVAIVLSFSRSAYVALVFSLVYLFLAQKKWKELLISLCLFSLFIVFVPKPFGEGGNLLRTASINTRMQDYKLGLSLWQKKPIFGYGYNRIRFAKEHLNLISVDDRSHSLASFHSSFLIILVTAGVVGFAAFTFLACTFFQKYPRLRVYVIYIFIMSLFDNVLLHVLVILPFLFIAVHISQESLE